MPLAQARNYLSRTIQPAGNEQIRQEIDWFLQFHQPQPAVFLAYDRVAYTCPAQPDLRLTFDSKLRWREQALDLAAGDYGEFLTPPGTRILEIKVSGAMPLWLSAILDQLEIYPASFSKYGTYYKQRVLGSWQMEGVVCCA